jgi:hypothetical protein
VRGIGIAPGEGLHFACAGRPARSMW